VRHPRRQTTNRLPIEVVMRDEELGWPDHYEFCERAANLRLDDVQLVTHLQSSSLIGSIMQCPRA